MLTLFHRVVDGVFEPHRVERIAVFGRYVEVTQQRQARVGQQLFTQPAVQRRKPQHLVGKLLRSRGLAVHEVAVHQTQFPVGRVQRGGNDAGLLVRVPGDVAHHVAHGVAAQDSDAVVGLLAKSHGLIACLLERVVRKFVVGELELLQAQRIDRVGREPGQHLGQADGEGVDIPGGDLHVFGLQRLMGKR